MKLIIRSHGNTDLNLTLPTGLALNGFAAGKIAAAARKHHYELTTAQAKLLIRGVKEYRRTHPEWVLVEIHSANGDEVFLQL